MADLNEFPLVLAIREDGSVDNTIASFERGFGAATDRVASGFDAISRSVRALEQQAARKVSDPLGLKAAVQSLSASPMQKALDGLASSEQALSQQRARESAVRVAAISREFDAALAGIRAEQSARSAAFAQAEREGLALVQLQQQRAAEMARTVAGPQQVSGVYFDPQGSAQAATAARAQAVAMADLARNAEVVAGATASATAADRAFAATAREAATAAGIEASRLEQLAATQGRVAAAAVAAGGKASAAGDLVTNSVRDQRFATIQATQQVQDFFVQVQGGQNVLIAFSQQISQLAFVTAGAGGNVGKLASFIAGPYGTAILGGIAVLSIFTAGLFANRDAQDGAAGASDHHAQAAARLKEALDRLTKAQAVLNHETRQGIQDDLDAAEAKRIQAVRTLQLARANLQGSLAKASDPTLAGEGGFNPGAAASANYAAQIAELDAIEKGATTAIAVAKSKIALRDVASATDAARKATTQYEDALDQIQRRFQVGGYGDPTTAKADARQRAELLAATKRRDAALEAAKADRRTSSTGAQIPTLNAQARLAAADSPLEIARAELTLTKAQSAELLRQGKITADTYRIRVQAKEVEVQRAEGMKAATAAGERAARAYQKLVDFGDRAGESIAQITSQFDDQPRLIDRAAAATRKLDDLIADLEQRKPPGFEELVRQANAAKDAVETGITKPFRDLIERQKEQLAIGGLILGGRQDEADAMQIIYDLQRDMGPLTQAQQAIILGNVAALKNQSVELERQRLSINAQVDAARRLQDAFTAFFENPFAKGGLKNLGDSITKSRQKQIAEQLSIQLFGGDLGSKVYDALTRGSAPLKDAADRQNAVTDRFGKVVDAFGAKVAAANDNPSIAQQTTTPSAYGLARGLVPNLLPMANEVFVNGRAGNRGLAIDEGLNLNYNLLADIGRVGDNIGDLGAQAKRQAAIQQAATVGLSFAAQAIGGKGGRAINAGLNAIELSKAGEKIATKIGGSLGKSVGGAVAGIGQGLFADSVVKLFGGKGSATGGAIGGAIGGALPIPGGALIGGAIGSIIGGLFKKPKFGTAAVSGNASGSSVAVGGNSSTARSGAGSLGEAVQNGVASIAEQLGGLLGDYRVSIGTFDGKYRVSTAGFTGSLDSKKAKGQGLVDFGKDGQEAAIRFAIADAIKDGAVQGLRAGTQRLISLGTDLDRQLQKALSFEGVFRELKALKDPIGAATDDIDKQLAALKKVFDEAGASSDERAQLEELYALKRVDAVKQAQEQLTGQLRALLDDLKYKGDTGLSLRTRETNALTALNPLIAQIQSGKTVDQTAFSETARAYLDIERQIYGSTQAYFEKLTQITDLTALGIGNTGAKNVVPISDAVRTAMAPTSAAAIAALVPPVDTASIVAAVQAQTAAVTAQTSAVTSRIDLLTRVTAEKRGPFELQIAGGGSTLPLVAALRNA